METHQLSAVNLSPPLVSCVALREFPILQLLLLLSFLFVQRGGGKPTTVFTVRRKNKIILVKVSDPRMWVDGDVHLSYRSHGCYKYQDHCFLPE